MSVFFQVACYLQSALMKHGFLEIYAGEKPKLSKYNYAGGTTFFGVLIPVLLPLSSTYSKQRLVEESNFYFDFGTPLAVEMSKLLGFEVPPLTRVGTSSWLVIFDKIEDSITMYKYIGFKQPKHNIVFQMGIGIDAEEDIYMAYKYKNSDLEPDTQQTVDLMKEVGRCLDPWTHGLRPQNLTRSINFADVAKRLEINTGTHIAKAIGSSFCYSLNNVIKVLLIFFFI